MAGFLAENTDVSLGDVAYTLFEGRRHFDFRRVISGFPRSEEAGPANEKLRQMSGR